jgi:hypothetical protein
MARFKDRVSSAGTLLAAAKRRIDDIDHIDITSRERENLAVSFMRTVGDVLSVPPLRGGRLINSNAYSQFWRDSKYFVGVVNGHATQMSELVSLNTKDIFSAVSDIEGEVLALDSEVGEEEIKLIEHYDKVHLNRMTRSIDDQIQFDDADWIEDFKTSFSYPERFLLSTLPNAGITLPVRSKQDIPIIDAIILHEGTDVGDTLIPMVSTSARNVFLKNKVFRHVVVRKAYDATSRLFKRKTSSDEYPYSARSTLTIQLELPNNILLNFLEIEPGGNSTLSLQSLSYVNEAGETVGLSTVSIPSPTALTLLFQPIQTRYLVLTFEQFAPVAATSVVIGDERARAMNKLLEGAGFLTKFADDSVEIVGRVFDFSIKNLSVGSVLYEDKGIFRSFPIQVESPIGVDARKLVEATVPVNRIDAYRDEIILPDGQVLQELYVGARLFDEDGNRTLDDLIPLPDSYPVQSEFLDPSGTDARVKLFPDIRWNEVKNRVTSLWQAPLPFDGPVAALITTTNPHGLAVGDEFYFRGPHSIILPPESEAISVYEVVDDWSFRVLTIPSWGWYPDGPTPDITDSVVYITRVLDGAAGFDLFEGQDTLLALGTDYQFSIDGGSTYHSSFDTITNWEELLRRAEAGRFYIRFTDRKSEEFYWVKYRIQRNQKLNRSGTVNLKNGRVIFSNQLRGSKGTFQTVLISRPNTSNHYLTFVVRQYSLKVQEYGS